MGKSEKNVLVAVLKSKRDFGILMREKWYRVPVVFLPKKKFSHIAFYQPATFGRKGKQIRYYAQVMRQSIMPRIKLLPKETSHPWAKDDYVKFQFQDIGMLAKPIRNIIPRRVSFGFTSLKLLCSVRDILQLYGVSPTEQIMERRLRQAGIATRAEFPIVVTGKRFRIDLAVMSEFGNIAVECDNDKAHINKTQKRRDTIKDAALKRGGWRIVRLKEADIIERPEQCVACVKKAMSLTPFQQKIYEAIRGIPKGKTMTYAQVAAAVGRPRAYRAVGNALNRNPFAPTVPCHRVIRSDGSVGGFAHGSSNKLKILRAEGAI